MNLVDIFKETLSIEAKALEQARHRVTEQQLQVCRLEQPEILLSCQLD